MISKPLYKKSLSTALKLGAVILAIVFLYDIVIVYMFDPKLADMINQFQTMMPQMMSIFGMTNNASTMIGFLDTYLYGMVLMIFPLLYSILLTNKLIESYIDKGSMACLLATPNSRRKIITTQLTVLITSISLMMIINTIGLILMCEIMFPGTLDIPAFLLLNLSMLLIQLAICGVTFASACFAKDSRTYYLLGAGIPILFYVIQMMANMGDRLSVCKYLTIFTLFEDQKILQGQNVIISCITLLLISIFLYVAGIWRFSQKDLSL